MRHGGFAALGSMAIVIAVVALAPVFVAGQSPTAAANKTAVDKKYAPPKTSWGHPDLQGTWTNNTVTPLERPKEVAGRLFLTDQELASLKAKASQLFGNEAGDAAFGDSVFQAALADSRQYKSSDGQTGNYNHFWLVERDFDNRTSLIVDPPAGKLPALTPEGKRLADARAARRKTNPADSWEDRGLSERCITFGLPNLLAGYNTNYRILQTPEYVVIHQEMIHDTRIIPLDGRPHLADNIRQWYGDSRGRWEGNTLVVDTINFSPKTNFRGAADGMQYRTLHAREPCDGRVPIHGQRPEDLDEPLDRHDSPEAE